MELYEKRIKRTNFFFLVLVVLYVGFSFLAGYFLQNDLLQSCITEIFLLCIGIIFLICQKVNIKEYIRLRRVDIVSILFSILYGICLIPIVTIINAFSMLFVKNVASASISGMVNQGFLSSFLVIAIIPAIVEEFLFRGIIYRGYRQARPIRGILYSAFLFGALHMNFNQFCYAFFMGIAMGVLAEVTDSLVPSMFVHCLFNGQTVCLMYLLKALTNLVGGIGGANISEAIENANATMLTQQEVLSVMIVYLPFAIGGAALAIVLLIALAKRNHRYNYMMTWFSKEYKEDREQLPKPSIISISFILALLICLGVCVITELF
ncbi:MAG: lysostaphin resistance A-like protein [Lachnospiraceae bacterium]